MHERARDQIGTNRTEQPYIQSGNLLAMVPLIIFSLSLPSGRNLQKNSPFLYHYLSEVCTGFTLYFVFDIDTRQETAEAVATELKEIMKEERGTCCGLNRDERSRE